VGPAARAEDSLFRGHGLVSREMPGANPVTNRKACPDLCRDGRAGVLFYKEPIRIFLIFGSIEKQRAGRSKRKRVARPMIATAPYGDCAQ
jgi:hypothetical protein